MNGESHNATTKTSNGKLTGCVDIGSRSTTSACSFQTANSSRGGSSTDLSGSTGGAGVGSTRTSSLGLNAGSSDYTVASGGLAVGDPRLTNLNHFHGMVKFDAEIDAGHFTKVKGLSGCCQNQGKVELYSWEGDHRPEGEDNFVVAKRVKASCVMSARGQEPCEWVVFRNQIRRNAEDTWTEIAVYSLLASQKDMPEYILGMHSVFQYGCDIWLVLENAEGGDLFGEVYANGGVDSGRLLQWMWELLQAVAYIHYLGIAHRDISIENVLLRQGLVKLMDFGQAVKTCENGRPLRYFRPIGKPGYRPAECHVPNSEVVYVDAPPNAASGDVVFGTTDTNALCQVQLSSSTGAAAHGRFRSGIPWGYEAAPVDVAATGFCLFLMITGSPPYRETLLTDVNFAWVRQNGYLALLEAWGKSPSPETCNLLVSMLAFDPARRSTAAECLRKPAFSLFKDKVVPVHKPLCRNLVRPGEAMLVEVRSQCQTNPQSETADIRANAAPSSTRAVVSEDWRVASVQATGFSGDFYASADVHRSVAIDPEMLASSEELSFHSCTGDFYSEQGGARRNVTGVQPKLSDILNTSGCPCPPMLQLTRFSASAACEPPSPPSGTPLAPTTIRFDCEDAEIGKRAAEVGNQLLDFLSMGAGAHVTKVNTAKYTMKADITGDAGSGSLKVRIFCEERGNPSTSRIAVEIQRRGGDAVAITSLFRKAKEFFGFALDASNSPQKAEALLDACRSSNPNSRPSPPTRSSNQVIPDRTSISSAPTGSSSLRVAVPRRPGSTCGRFSDSNVVPSATLSFLDGMTHAGGVVDSELSQLQLVGPGVKGLLQNRRWRAPNSAPANIPLQVADITASGGKRTCSTHTVKKIPLVAR